MTSKTSYLKTIDTTEKAYCLGFFLNIGSAKSSFSDCSYELTNIDKEDDKKVLDLFKNVVDIIYDVKITNDDEEPEEEDEDIKFATFGNNEDEKKLSMTLHDDKDFKDIIDNLNNLATFTNDQKKAFLRGLYEYSHLMNLNDKNNCDLVLIRPLIFTDELVEQAFDYTNIPYISLPSKIIFRYGCNSVDFLGFLYSNIDDTYSLQMANYTNIIPQCLFLKTEEGAIAPSKTNWSDVGYDLSIIKKVKDFNSKSALYDTGIKIQVDFGYYAEIVPRSSISKSGYILSNNIGIIDNSYRGNLLIALTKIADDAIEIEYPFKCCQLIFKKQNFICMKEGTKENFETSKRKDGGFGSTDNYKCF